MSSSLLELRAGPHALAHLRAHGLAPEHVSHVAAAAGGPKWLVLAGIDRVLYPWLRGADRPVHGVGASIGAWRLAAGAQADPRAAMERFLDCYLGQRYPLRPGPDVVSATGRRILEAMLGMTGRAEIAASPFLRLNVIVTRLRTARHPRQTLRLRAGLAGAVAANFAGRHRLDHVLERVNVHHAAGDAGFRPDGIRTRRVTLTAENLAPALMAGASIPGVMEPVDTIPGAPPGVYMDGGILDYHMDLPLADPDGLVLLPHFASTVTPGWLDRFVPWRGPRHLDRTLLIAPAPGFLARLANGRVPDRRDFVRLRGDDTTRIAEWRRAVAESDALADELMQLVASGRIADVVRPFGGTAARSGR